MHFDPKKVEPIAVFAGRPYRLRQDHRREPLSALKVYPAAYDGPLLDYVVLGALMIERRRLSPWNDAEGLLSSRKVSTTGWN
jgi:hypothetical protein